MQDLRRLFVEWRDDLVERALAELRSAHLAHYEKEGSDILRERLSALCDLAERCLADHSAEPAIEHARRIARERYEAGYHLGEVQISISVLEEAVCQRALASFNPEEVARALGLLITIFDLTKDTLAQVYVDLASGVGAGEQELDGRYTTARRGDEHAVVESARRDSQIPSPTNRNCGDTAHAKTVLKSKAKTDLG